MSEEPLLNEIDENSKEYDEGEIPSNTNKIKPFKKGKSFMDLNGRPYRCWFLDFNPSIHFGTRMVKLRHNLMLVLEELNHYNQVSPKTYEDFIYWLDDQSIIRGNYGVTSGRKDKSRLIEMEK